MVHVAHPYHSTESLIVFQRKWVKVFSHSRVLCYNIT
jgi:hypothetical protein